METADISLAFCLHQGETKNKVTYEPAATQAFGCINLPQGMLKQKVWKAFFVDQIYMGDGLTKKGPKMSNTSLKELGFKETVSKKNK